MLTPVQIQFLNQISPNWTETNNIVDVMENVNMVGYTNLIQIPIQFGQIDGNFCCYRNCLIRLKGSPYIINGFFNSACNILTSLENGPLKIKGEYNCNINQLKNLIGAPCECNDNFDCSKNRLTSLEGCPKSIKGNLQCTCNSDLNILYGIGRVEGKVYYDHVNDLNEWIIQRARENIFSTYTDIANWIKSNKKYEFLLHSSKEIRQHFSEYIIKSVELNLC